ncbi:hypothetical protein [uncultured Marivirga sp.]|uniref:hypothetical protein n=1 Tax=uncultured Marivirga sp. TaxID=1123707 RepID=UPI0030EC4CA7|tara:strand:- start:258051 stop:258800 length:750 start_codon:yes stop_codon:yes gene_type:complete
MHRLLVLLALSILPIGLSAQINFGATFGIKSYYSDTNISGRYQGVDLRLDGDNGRLYNQGGLFLEINSEKYDFLSLRFNAKTHNQVFFLSVVDYDPPPEKGAIFIPNEKVFFALYQSYLFNVMPSLVVKRKIEYRFSLGYELNYMHHKNKEGIFPYDASERWLSRPTNQKLLDFANEAIIQNPMKTFNHNLVLVAEARYWYLGLEVQYDASINSIAEPINFKGEFIYPFRMNTGNFSVNLNYYWKKISY